MIPTILKNSIKDRPLLTLWMSVIFLAGLVLSLSPDNPIFSLAYLLSVGLLLKITAIQLLVSMGLTISLMVLHKRQKVKINIHTCDWLPNPGVWKHKISGINFCPTCHSPLSSELYCAKCNRGYGKGEVFTVDW